MNERSNLSALRSKIFTVSEKAADGISPPRQNEASSKFLSTNHSHALPFARRDGIAYLGLRQMNHPYKPESLPHALDLNLKQTRLFLASFGSPADTTSPRKRRKGGHREQKQPDSRRATSRHSRSSTAGASKGACLLLRRRVGWCLATPHTYFLQSWQLPIVQNPVSDVAESARAWLKTNTYAQGAAAWEAVTGGT